MTTTVSPQELGAETAPSVDEPVTPATAEPVEREESSLRRAIAVGLFCAGTAAVAGGLFTGWFTPRFIAVLTALLGCALGVVIARTTSPALVAISTVGGIFVLGLLGAVIVGGFGAIPDLADLLSKAFTESNLLRPPIRMSTGFGALVGWLMGGIGFGATWTAVVLRRPAMAMLVPLPIAAITAISAPHDAQIASGVVLVVTFALSLFLLSTDRSITGADDVPLRYEIRRAVRAVPVVGVIVVVLVLIAQTDLLFPQPIINPALEAQKPKTIPISETEDRVLFETKSRVTGPWIMGVLDVYDGTDWRLPPFDETRLVEVERSGIVSREFKPGIKATITVRGLGGAVLPTLPNTVGVVASGPRLSYDARSGNIRLVEGEISSRFEYALAGAAIPRVDDLKKAEAPPDDLVKRFTLAPLPPPAAQALIDDAPKTSLWEQWDFMRRYVLDEIVVSGAGSPVPIPPARVDEVLTEKEGSPFEIVAIQTLLARWIGIPARIGYGFDGGSLAGDHREYRPKDGAVFPQVYFEGNGWLPVIGIPAKTKVTDTSDPNLQQFKPGVLPSDDIAVTLFRPVERPGSTLLYERLRIAALIALVILLVLLAAYLVTVPLQKALLRGRRRADALELGPRARVANAYAEFRDLLTDLGYHHETDTPLMLLQRFPPDEEHKQLAWLVTRALWGDLTSDDSSEIAEDAEELSAAMRRRLREAHPITVRFVAAISRRSLRSPYAVTPIDSAFVSRRTQELSDVAV